MAINASSQYEVQTGGNDTNGGGFSALTVTANLAATVATSTAPVVTSATYNFVAADVGSYVFIKSGTNWIPGWYKIVSVATNAATLNAAIGAVTLWQGTTILNTTAGCATTASPTSGSWSVDYSQNASKNTTGSNISTTDAGTNGTTVTSATANFQPSILGNHIYLSGGTGSITGSWFEVTAVASTSSITVDRSVTAGAQTGATMNIGGAMLTILATMDRAWKTSGSATADTVVWVQKGSYSGATLTTSGYLGPSQYQSRLIGYNVIRGDNPTIASGNCPSYATTGAGVGGWLNLLNGYSIWNFTFDGTGTTGAAVGCTNTGAIESCVNVKCSNYSGGGFSVAQAAFLEAFNNTGVGISGSPYYSYAHKNTSHGIATGNQSPSIFNCVSANNGGIGLFIGYQCGAINCIVFGNTGDGINMSSLQSGMVLNNIIAANGGWGINVSGSQTPYNRGLMVDYNAYHHNTSGTVTGGVTLGVHDVVIAGTASTTPFNQTEANNKSETSPDWTLNNTAGAGALLRGAGLPGVQPGVFATTPSFKDFGPLQHRDSNNQGAIVAGVSSISF